jgi:copper chaperone NosL
MKYIALLLAALLPSTCDSESSGKLPAAHEMSDSSVAAFCGMSLQEHSGPKAQIFIDGQSEPVWFASVHDMFAFTLLPEEPKAVVAIYVNDMGRARNWDRPEPGTWIDAHKAYFVIGGRKTGGMDEKEAVPFANRAAAAAFIAENGGRQVRFSDMPEDYVLPYPTDTPSAGEHE